MNIKKIAFLILLIVLINIIFIPKTFAFSDIVSAGDEFLNSGDPADSVINETKLSNVSSKIYNILLVCGIGVAVIVGAVLGITFIMSSAEGKAKVSETLVPYIIGCVVVFGAFTIWRMAIDMGNSVAGDGAAGDEEVVVSEYSEEKGRKAQEYYNNKNIDKLGDQEVIDLFENLKKYSGEDEVDPMLYNYYKKEADKRKGNIIINVRNDNSIEYLSDDKLNEYFDYLKKYSGEDEVDPELYNYYKDEIERRKK